MTSAPFSHRRPRQWLKIKVTAHDREIEIAAGILTDLTGNGVEFVLPVEENNDGRTTIIGYLEINPYFSEKKEKLESLLKSLSASGNISFEYDKIEEEDWGENWKKNFKTFKATKSIAIKPSWDTYSPSDREIVVEIDPGMAFGTGHHATTSLALELIDGYFAQETGKDPAVLDVGTGTGILGIACCKLAPSRVLAIDNDPDAVAAARQNVNANGVAGAMTVTDTPLTHLEGSYDLIIANIVYGVLMDLAPQINRLIGKGGQLILSGILKGDQAQKILAEYGSYGLEPQQTAGWQEWQSFRFIKE